MMLKTILLLQCLSSLVLCLPVDLNPSSKHVQWIKEEDSRTDDFDLLSPIDNLVEPEGTKWLKNLFYYYYKKVLKIAATPLVTLFNYF